MGIEGEQRRVTRTLRCLLPLPLRRLMEGVLSQTNCFIRGLVSDNSELSVTEKQPQHPQTHTSRNG